MTFFQSLITKDSDIRTDFILLFYFGENLIPRILDHKHIVLGYHNVFKDIFQYNFEEFLDNLVINLGGSLVSIRVLWCMKENNKTKV